MAKPRADETRMNDENINEVIDELISRRPVGESAPHGAPDFATALAIAMQGGNQDELNRLLSEKTVELQGGPDPEHPGVVIPLEHRTEPMCLTEAARRLGYTYDNSTRESGRKQVERAIADGSLRALKIRLKSRKWWFDSRQVLPKSK